MCQISHCDLGMTFKNYVENFELSMTNIQEFTFLKQTTNMISLFLCAGLLTLYAALKSYMCTEILNLIINFRRPCNIQWLEC